MIRRTGEQDHLHFGEVWREQESQSVSLKQVVYGNAGMSYTC